MAADYGTGRDRRRLLARRTAGHDALWYGGGMRVIWVVMVAATGGRRAANLLPRA
jgi:hypothetical protein